MPGTAYNLLGYVRKGDSVKTDHVMVDKHNKMLCHLLPISCINWSRLTRCPG